MTILCCSVALANTRAFDDNAGWPRPILAPRVDKLVVDKTRRRLILMGRKRVVRSYRASFGGAGGANSAPVGRYIVAGRNPKSPFHLALRLAPVVAAQGGGLQLHGTPDWLGPLAAALHGSDWTPGGIGVANDDIEEIWNLVPDGTPVAIKP
ncbi:MAG: L,D-transpeptidase [Zoogloeaceae bacterium]|jgi:murein L,D-transpeptidase YafK|nr:L,D-transpeptidase [Zoogloeaceae bacterium]